MNNTTQLKIIRCPHCFSGRLLDASPKAAAELKLYPPSQADKADWFVKCPVCKSQIGIEVRKKSLR